MTLADSERLAARSRAESSSSTIAPKTARSIAAPFSAPVFPGDEPFDGASELGYKIQEASCGEVGLELLAEAKPDCILLDYRLPDMDGLDFLDRLRASGEDPAAVVVLTGQGDEAVAVQAMRKGAQDYLVKGLGSAELRQAMRQRDRSRHPAPQGRVAASAAREDVGRAGQADRAAPGSDRGPRRGEPQQGRVRRHAGP